MVSYIYLRYFLLEHLVQKYILINKILLLTPLYDNVLTYQFVSLHCWKIIFGVNKPIMRPIPIVKGQTVSLIEVEDTRKLCTPASSTGGIIVYSGKSFAKSLSEIEDNVIYWCLMFESRGGIWQEIIVCLRKLLLSMYSG